MNTLKKSRNSIVGMELPLYVDLGQGDVFACLFHLLVYRKGRSDLEINLSRRVPNRILILQSDTRQTTGAPADCVFLISFKFEGGESPGDKRTRRGN